jgi:tetratricopeptide (TPR) repeat protein
VELKGVDSDVARLIGDARAAVIAAPAADTAWGRLGMVLAAHGFGTSATTCFAEAARLNPAEPRWAYLPATEFGELTLSQAAIELGRAADLLADQADAPAGAEATARLRLAELLLRVDRVDEAAAQLDRVLLQNPRNARARLNLARVARQRGDWPAALSHLRRCEDDAHVRKAARILAAEVHLRAGDERAAREARAAAATLPDDANWPDPLLDEVMQLRAGIQVRLTAAARLIDQGRSNQAVVDLHKLVEDYPESHWAWTLLGRAYFKQDNWPDAERALRRAAQIQPDSPQPYFYLGTGLLLRGQHAEAADAFRAAVRAKPDYAEAYQNLGHCLLGMDDDAGAAEAFGAAIRCKPDFAQAHGDLGELLARTGDAGQAAVHLRQALRLNPADARAARLLRGAKNFEN